MFKSYIKLRVLKNLNKESLSGYDLMKYIGEGGNKPSPGYIYPLLKDLQKKGFILVSKDGRRKVYSITQKGKNLLEKLKNKQKEMINTISVIGDKKEMEVFLKLKSNIVGKDCFLQKGRRLRGLYKLIFQICKTGDDKKLKEIDAILENTIKRLEKLK
jgi:DNA-binding PadR family transcriptional regulator